MLYVGIRESIYTYTPKTLIKKHYEFQPDLDFLKKFAADSDLAEFLIWDFPSYIRLFFHY